MKGIYLFWIFCSFSVLSFSQNIGIGTASPDAAAILDISSAQKGLLIPRMTQAERNAILQPANSLLIYQTDATPGFYYNKGTPASPAWTSLSSGGSGGAASWELTGNAGTDSVNNFIGNTDDIPLIFRINNQQAAKITRWSANTFFGYHAGNNISSGMNDVGIGLDALTNDNTGNDNIAIGKSALLNTQNGNGNIALGGQTMRNNVNGVVNIGIGYGAEASLTNLSNATAIGWSVIVNASNKVIIGTNTTGMVVGGYVNWSNLSDGRFKENVTENVPGLAFITKLRPVTYTINSKLLDEHLMQAMPEEIRLQKMKQPEEYARASLYLRTGFIAQEVEAAAASVNYNFDGINKPTNPTDTYSLAYGSFVVPIVKAIQEQQAIIDELKMEITDLKKLVGK